ncbi:Mrp/NBP35 family ATP-binding protein [Caloramator sp.]|uniref:Mrp/NBP35 family ATP-binding protein n=1 Tax=Caloramator sp. TaxID=1871330 RepID=UPI0025C273B7|nr:Mrp/NBP35 family ATP-binding protein [Caloramator sp.]
MSNCSTCPSNSSCSKDKETCMVQINPNNRIKKVIAVMSGKGGVGKSTVSVLLAKKLNELGYSVGIMDADVTGPSIPRLLNIREKARGTEEYILPVETEDGIKVMSVNLLMEDENQPVLWRGPVISGVITQFWTDVLWEDLDYLIIDMPPGTSDVALTVMQSIPINGVVMVSIPQDLVTMIVMKAINMARKLNIDVLGVIQNMSYINCPDCGKKIRLFNSEKAEEEYREMGVDILGELPMTQSLNNYNDLTQDRIEFDKIFTPIVLEIMKKLN